MKVLYIILGCSIFFTLSCENSYTHLFNKKQRIQFVSKKADENNPSYIIMYLDEKLRPIKTEVSSGDSFTIPILKNRYTPVLLLDSLHDENPLGCIYPLSTTCTIQGGFAAWIFYRIAISSNESHQDIYSFLSRFNWMRFQDYIQKYENPWILNQNIIIHSIADKSFNIYSIKELSQTF